MTWLKSNGWSPTINVSYRVPPSKSVTHRAYLLAALCDEPTLIHGPLRSGDCDHTRAALSQLGASFTDVDGGVIVCGPLKPKSCPTVIDVGNAGTALRLLIAQCARFTRSFTLTGDKSLRSRSSSGLLDGLKRLGVSVQSDGGCAPVKVMGPFTSARVELPPAGSSQFGSALVLALAAEGGTSCVRLERPIHSQPYFELTLSMLGAFGVGVEVDWCPDACVVAIGDHALVSPKNFIVEGDWSSAAFLLVGAFLLDRKVTLDGLVRESVQADRAIIKILEAFGAVFHWSTTGAVTMHRASQQCPKHIDVRDCPDLFPVLCVLASSMPQEVRIDGAPNLRHKESDRIRLMAQGLASVGMAVQELADGLTVRRGVFRPALVATELDHRIHMSFRVLSMLHPGLLTDGTGCESVSYPNFEADLRGLRVD